MVIMDLVRLFPKFTLDDPFLIITSWFVLRKIQERMSSA